MQDLERGAKIVAAVVTAGLLLVGILVVREVWFPGREFDPDIWQDESSLMNGARHDMAVRLEVRGVLVGKTRAEIIEMLGEPCEGDTYHPEPHKLVYRLGPTFMDSEWLTVRLGQDGRVTECYRWTD